MIAILVLDLQTNKCIALPTPRTDKGSSSITNNMITFNGISVYNILNFKSKRYSL